MNCDVPALWLEHKEMLRKYILKRVHDEDTANDILQDVLMKVYNFCMAKSGVRNEKAWLFQITYNTMMDHFRKNKKYTSLGEKYDASEKDLATAQQEAAAYVLPLINLLPEEYALPLRLSEIEGMKQKDIAEQMGITHSNAKTRISRAREKLRELFIECTEFELDQKGGMINFNIKPDCKPLATAQQELKRKNILPSAIESEIISPNTPKDCNSC